MSRDPIPHAWDATMSDGTAALVIDSDIPDDAPTDVREGLARRSVVNGGGRCPCGAVMILPNRAERRRARRTRTAVHIDVEHEVDCPAITTTLLANIAAWRGEGR